VSPIFLARRLGLILLHGIVACSSPAVVEPGPAPPATILTLALSHVIEGEAIHVGQTYTTRYGQQVTFDHLRYWVSNVVLAHGKERFKVPASYYLVEQTPDHERLSLTIRGIPPGSYDTLIFHLGVDPPHNASHASAEGELAAGAGMDWTGGAGYKFLTAGGKFQQDDLAGSFSFATGMDVLYKELTAKLPAPVELVAEEEIKIALEAEVDRIFAGVQLATEATVTGGTVDSPAARIAGNYSRMFGLVTEGTKIPLTATSPNIDPPDDGPAPTDSKPPVLSMPVVESAGLFCAEVKDRPVTEERACMTPFQLLPASGATYDAGLFTFVTSNDAPVHASAPGVVSDITYLEHSMLTHSDLFTVSVQPSAGSAYWMVYGNVKNLKVAEGDAVPAGQLLGGAGDYFNESSGLVSFGVRRHQELDQRLCPTRFTTPELESVYHAALTTSNAAWPALAHDDLCSATSLLCTGGKCASPADFAPVHGDIDEGRRIYKEGCALCHGEKGQGSVGPKLCFGPTCSCKDCGDHAALAASVESDMPPEGYCDPKCAADVAAFILHDFVVP